MKTICSIIFIVFTISIYAQGSVDIEYYPIDSINQSFIGKEIRIDFMIYEDYQIIDSAMTFRSFLKSEDTFSLKIQKKLVQFKEKWLLYPDEALLRDQTCRSVNSKDPILIREIILERVDLNSITVTIAIYDLSYSYFELDNKRMELDRKINDLDKNSPNFNNERIELEREKRKIDREEKKLDSELRNTFKLRRQKERIVIDKSIIKGILIRD
jgi:hypothetical protein